MCSQTRPCNDAQAITEYLKPLCRDNNYIIRNSKILKLFNEPSLNEEYVSIKVNDRRFIHVCVKILQASRRSDNGWPSIIFSLNHVTKPEQQVVKPAKPKFYKTH